MLTAGAKLAAGASEVTARERWLLENHTQAMRDAIASMTHYDEYSLRSGQLKSGVDYMFDQRFSARSV